MEEKGKNLQYEKPELIDIRKRGAEGQNCLDGSGNPAYCEAGTAASGSGCSVGVGVIGGF